MVRSALPATAGSATFNNGPGASQTGTIAFTGDQGSATFNNGAVAIADQLHRRPGVNHLGTGTATTSARSASPAIKVRPPSTTGREPRKPGTISFTGDQGSATFNNGVLSGTTTISFTGDQSSASLSNGIKHRLHLLHR